MSEQSIAARLRECSKNKFRSLDLSNLSLRGIPSEVFAIDSLLSLNLSKNLINIVPEEINQLRKLESLDLEGNSGICFANLSSVPSSLMSIDLSKTFLGSVPAWVFDRDWVQLELSDCGIAKIPNDLANQRKLRSLFLNGNNLVDIPDWFGKLDLKNLSLSYNKLTKFPEQIIEFKDLEYLGISGNKIGSIPAEIKNLKKLRYLHAAKCGLNAFPVEIADNQRLLSLNLAFNEIQEVPDEIVNFEQLERLDLEGNTIHFLSENISKLYHLERLDLRDNNISRVPTQIGRLHSLELENSQSERSRFDGLHLSGNPLPPIIKKASELDQPEATSQLLDILNNYDEHIQRFDSFGADAPTIHRPSIGPIFAERNEQLDLEPGQGFYGEPNKRRFSALHDELRETINDLDNALGSSSDAHQGLIKAARRYKNAISKPIEETNVNQIYALGLRFESAWQTAQREIKSSFEPPLEDSQQEALTSVLRIHAAFVASTEEGRELLEASLRYEFKKRFDEKFKELARPVARGATGTPGLLTDEAGELLEEAVEGVAEGPSEGRSGLIGRLTVTNVLTAVAMAVVGKLSAEIFLISDLGQFIVHHGSSLFDKSLFFLMSHETELRLLASNSPEGLGWIRHFLDWLKIKLGR